MGFLFGKKNKEEPKKQEQIRKEQQAQKEAELKQKIADVLAKKEYTLWDNIKKPLNWFYGETAKAVYEDCIANADEMWFTMREEGKRMLKNPNATEIDGLPWVFLEVCFELWRKKSWLIVFYNEFMKSRYEYLSFEIKNKGFLNPLFWLMQVADIRQNDDSSKVVIPFPDCLQEDKNPMLYYLSRSLKEVFTHDASGVYSTLGPDVAMKYIYNALSKGGIDVSKEEWLYDKSFFFTALSSLKSDATIAEQIQKVAKYPEYLPKINLSGRPSAGDFGGNGGMVGNTPPDDIF